MAFFKGRPATALTLACVLAMSSLLVQPALAFDPTGNDAADHLLKILEAGGGKVTSVDGVTEDGDTVTVTGVAAEMTQEGETSTLSIKEISLEDPEIQSDGRLKAASFSLTGLTIEDGKGALSVETIESVDVSIPAPEAITASGPSEAIAPSYKTAELTGIAIRTEDDGSLKIGRISATVDEMDGDLPTAGSAHVEGITIAKADLDEDGQKMLSDLGYDEIVLSMDIVGTWEPDTGDVLLDGLTIRSDEVGTLAFTAKLGGVTRAVYEELGKVQNDPEKAMALLQGVTVSAMTIQLDNDSIIDRVLDHQAREAGTDRAAFVQQISASIPMMLAILDNPSFQSKVETALVSFLKEPKSLRAVASPAAPVTFAQIMGTAMMAPQSLPDVLGVAISANEN